MPATSDHDPAADSASFEPSWKVDLTTRFTRLVEMRRWTGQAWQDALAAHGSDAVLEFAYDRLATVHAQRGTVGVREWLNHTRVSDGRRVTDVLTGNFSPADRALLTSSATEFSRQRPTSLLTAAAERLGRGGPTITERLGAKQNAAELRRHGLLGGGTPPAHWGRR